MISTLLAHFTGMRMFEDRLFRGGAATVLAWVIIFFAMPHFIRFLQKRDATSDFTGSSESAPPIMGGVLVVAAVLIASLVFCQFNGYSVSILLVLVAYTFVGALDDLLKVKYKRLVTAGKISKKDYMDKADGLSSRLRLGLYFGFSLMVAMFAYKFIPGLDRHLAIPFIKPEILYPMLPNWAFIALICFVTTATANGANFTDGIDSLVSIPIITTALFAGIVAYISGNAIFAKYLLIPHQPGVDELLPIAGAMIGATLAYLWFNCPPAQIYMGDGGSIGLGGAIGMMFVLVKAELFLPIIGFIFVIEAWSSFTQIFWFKVTRKTRSDKTGQRLFLRAPLHEHYKLKWKDRYKSPNDVRSKIMWRFHLVSVSMFIIGTLIFFKIR
jgi:phospho-N-acetylmuramoyl-pentapeptide-transferase